MFQFPRGFDGAPGANGSSGANGDPGTLVLTVPLSTKLSIPTVPGRLETGTANLQLRAGDVLDFTINVRSLSSTDTLTVSHIHAGPLTGTGGVLVTLVDGTTVTFAVQSDGSYAASGSVTLNATQAAAVKNLGSELYVNVHSTDFPDGLVRGEIRRDVSAAFNVALDTASVLTAPSPASRTETGTAYLRLVDFDTLVYTVSVAGLVAPEALTIAHIHTGAVTASGVIFVDLVTTAVGLTFDSNNTATGAIALTSDQVDALTDRANPLYVNVHSSPTYGSGLLRGQIR